MQKARALLYVSLSILALSVAFHLGARSAHGQATSGDAVVWVSRDLVFTEHGNVYADKYGNGRLWEWRANVFAGDPVRARTRPNP
jgi:hypothetical protein